jgi:2-polyprenyl-3-methyl-5-hydroxy-6-metoxy-1,4-benzoquinol methylase
MFINLKEKTHAIGFEHLDRFARKGQEGGPNIPQSGLANGAKVRRIMQITRDFAQPMAARCRILDLGCGDGVYSIEAALRGAEVIAVDARSERMKHGVACAESLGLGNLKFIQSDVRTVTPEKFGDFDVIYLLGILYHFDFPDVFQVLEQVASLCAGIVIIDTLVSPNPDMSVEWKDRAYRGSRHREHEDLDSAEKRRERVLRSIDNTFSFWFELNSLLRALHDTGFTSVCNVQVPFEPGKANNRVTLVARKGDPVLLSTYPWMNDKSEGEIESIIKMNASVEQSTKQTSAP